MVTRKLYTVLFLGSVKKMLVSIPEIDRAKITANITIMSEGGFHFVYTKKLQAPIRELIVKKYRFIFFIHGRFLYFIHCFIKQSAKTPKQEINYARKIYQMIIQKITYEKNI
jgi:phage-related protein